VILKSVIACVLVLGHFGALAAPQWCFGKIPNVLTYAQGDLMVFSSWRNDWTVLCNVNGERLGVSAAVCRSWQAILLSAQAQGKTVVVHYYEAPSCDALPTYHAAPGPGYVRIDDTR
jgi:Mlc titration factor MtfA (ptsG expression regulator)